MDRFEAAYRVMRLERFASVEVMRAVATLRGALFDARSCQILGEIETIKGVQIASTDNQTRWLAALSQAQAARRHLGAYQIPP